VKFINLKIENFLTVGSIQAGLADKGLVLICGENLDDTSQDSNGSGKSSFVDALCWVLYGETARGISGDSVINDAAGKDCRVSTTIEIDGAYYDVIRHRKYPKKRNRLEVYNDKGEDLTLGTDKLTQTVVDKLIGATSDVFCASVYSGQENTPDLPGMTDINLKAIVEEAAGINQLEAAHKLARERKNVIQKELDVELSNLTFKKQRLEELEHDCLFAKPDVESWDKANKSELAKLGKNALTLKDDLAAASLAVSACRDIPSIDSEIDLLMAKLSGRKGEEAHLAGLRGDFAAVSLENSGVKRQLSVCVTKAKAQKVQLANLNDQLGEPCTSCGREHDESTLRKSSESIKQSLKEITLELRALKEESGSCTERAITAQEEITSFESTMSDVSEIIAAQSVLRDEKATVNKNLTNVVTKSAALVLAVSDYKRAKTALNPYLKSVSILEGRIATAATQVKDIRAGLIEIEGRLDVEKEVVHIFGPAGVRAHILDNVTPFLNDKTSEYLTILSDGNIQAVWNTLGETAKGEVREKFNIDVSSRTGGDSFRKLSGGEKRKVRLATSMALQDLVSSRATKPIDLFIADEVDAAIDESGLERLMTILKEKAAQVGTVLVISHSDLKSWISNSVTVVKEKGIARLDGTAL
jgi:DNA repair exonuclease SbcCD ATPase subunit